MINDYRDALQFVEDYFQINYQSFLNKYFRGSRQNEIKRTITPAKFRELFGELSPTQLKIISDNERKYIVVAAGPGSGKTRVLVHKLASLLLMEDVKHEQMLMITFSRAAATEFKKRLLKLIGNAANFIEMKTFHSYCFDLLGKVGTLEKSGEVIKQTIARIKRKEVEPSRITKTVLVIDEAQDMDADEFELINTLMEHNEDMRVIAVGDDDQNIYEFRGASSGYLEHFITVKKAIKYELVENYRSKRNLVDFTNLFAKSISRRLKDTPINAMQRDLGSIKIVRYQSSHLTMPLVQDMVTTDIAGTTCVLVKTNEEALQITGLLLQHGLKAKLIQTNDSFNLYNLLEVRYFLAQLHMGDDVFVISDESWANAKRKLWDKFRNSTMVDIIIQIIKDFEATQTKKKYLSDLEVFIRESKLEDFIHGHGETIFVSTIHKAKGKEFDNVFVLLDNYNAATDEAKRQLYVAMTRAKRNLVIHLNTALFDNFSVENLEYFEDTKPYEPPKQLVMQLTFKDIWLDYFAYRQHLIDQLMSGHSLALHEQDALSYQGKPVVKFSKHYLEEIANLKSRNYILTGAKVNAIVYWLKEGATHEMKIVLPELYFERRGEEDSVEY
jgi:ATP-dependent DNA helicase RecQ